MSNQITTTSAGTTCDHAIELVAGPALRELLRIHRPVILAALDEAAAERVERTQSSCTDCVQSAEERCEDHRATSSVPQNTGARRTRWPPPWGREHLVRGQPRGRLGRPAAGGQPTDGSERPRASRGP